MENESSGRVRERRVFYIPGYDPIHPRRYRELYRSEGILQAGISGYQIEISPKPAANTYGWNVKAVVGDASVAAEVEVLVWSDIVRDSMKNTILATYLQLVRTAWIYTSTGALRRLMWMRKGPVIAALYPVGMLLFQLCVAIFFGWLFGAIVNVGILGLVGLVEKMRFAEPMFMTGLRIIGLILKYVIWLSLAFYILRWFKSKDGKLYAYYLMHDYAFAAHLRGANPPALEMRMTEFGETIAAALNSNADEVLVVGHSSGAHLAISVLADLIRAGRVPDNGPMLSLLSLGQVVPMMSFLPNARRLRTDLAFLATSEVLTWVDVSAPGDGCAFALCDPVAVTGVAPVGKRWPLVISAAFTQSLSESRWKQLRWRFFRLHFQYLCAFDRPKDYDYFQITAGPVTLADRYRDRTPSKSRIDVAASNYVSVDA